MAIVLKRISLMTIITTIPECLSNNIAQNIKYRRDMNVPALSYKQLYPQMNQFKYSQPQLSKMPLELSLHRQNYDLDRQPLKTFQKQLHYPSPSPTQLELMLKLRDRNRLKMPRLRPQIFTELKSQVWPRPYPDHRIRPKPSPAGRHLPQLLFNQPQQILHPPSNRYSSLVKQSHFPMLQIPYLGKEFHPQHVFNQKTRMPSVRKEQRTTIVNLSPYPFVVILESNLPQSLIQYDGRTAVPIDVYRIGIGSLLSSTWVLTSAICAKSSVQKIRYSDISAPQNATNVFSPVLHKYRHPGFRAMETESKSIFNDIGLLLVEPVPINAFATLSAVDYMTLQGHEVEVAGYGMTESYLSKPESQYPLVFDKAAIKGCPQDITYGPAICATSLCNSTLREGYADLGGPLLYGGKVVGLYVGEYKTKFLSTIIYCPVSPFLHWIRVTMKNNDNLEYK